MKRRLGKGRWVLVTLAALLGMAVTASLGRWQLGRAAQKEALHAAIVAQQRLPVADGQALAALEDADSAAAQGWLHRRVALQGQWLNAHTVFLDNRQMAGRPGFFVLTPLRLQPGPGVVLVQRGWAPRDFQQRERLPELPPQPGTVQIEGRVALAPSRLFEFDKPQTDSGASRIRQNVTLPALAAESGLALAPLTVLQTSPADDGLARDWPVVVAGVEKHYGYAFQWFGLCGLIALLYVWFQIVRSLRRPAAAATQP